MTTTHRKDRAEILESLEDIAKAEGVEAKELAANVANQLETLRDKAQDRLEALKDIAQDKLGDVASQVDETARLKPWYFIGGAAALGYLVGRSLFNGKS